MRGCAECAGWPLVGRRGRRWWTGPNAELVVEHMKREQLPGHQRGRLLVAQHGAVHVELARVRRTAPLKKVYRESN